jgi:NTP pyrophosphatase (non-canonical NTP hydrolase)
MTECSYPFDHVLSFIEEVSKKEKKTLSQRALKLQEEVGEVAQALLIKQKAPGMSHKSIEHGELTVECIDVLLVTLDLFFANGGTKHTLMDLLSKKTKKWESSQSK